jgi:hypothetical protein
VPGDKPRVSISAQELTAGFAASRQKPPSGQVAIMTIPPTLYDFVDILGGRMKGSTIMIWHSPFLRIGYLRPVKQSAFSPVDIDYLSIDPDFTL